MSRRGEKTDETGVWQKEDGRYLVVAVANDPEGKERQRQKTLAEGKTLEDAVEVRESLMQEIRTPTTPERETLRLTDYCEQWMKRKARRLKPKTARTYARALGDKVLEVELNDGTVLGDVPVEELTRDHVLRWVDWAESQTHDDGTPYSTHTVRKWWRVFRQVLKDLHADGHTPRDFTQRIPPLETGRRGVREESALSAEQLRALVDTVRQQQPQRYAEVCTLAYTGMRSGELWALKWDAVNHESGTLEVKRSVSAGEVTETTKAHWDREVPMVEPVSRAIQQHRQWLVETQHPGLETGLVFPSDNGKPRTPGSLHKTLSSATEELGIDRRVGPQTLRKTWVTLVALEGVDRLTLRSVVGHKNEEMTEHYASIGTDAKRRAVEVLTEGGDARK